MIRADCHSHTLYSLDSRMTPADSVERAAAVGIDRIAVTDHNVIEGALEAHALAPERVIVGEEVTCGCGTHLIGLFLTERIPAGLPIEAVAERIRDQGGVVYAPHPYAYAWRAAWHAERALAVADVVEGVNSRAFIPAWNRRALREALRRGIPVAAGTDAHFPREIGRAYAEMPGFRNATEFLQAVRHARPVLVETASPVLLIASRVLEVSRQLVGWASPRTRSALADAYDGAAVIDGR